MEEITMENFKKEGVKEILEEAKSLVEQVETNVSIYKKELEGIKAKLMELHFKLSLY